MYRFLILCCALPQMGTAQPRLALPVDCTLGETCFIEDYVDNDPSDGRQRDFACGYNSRDAHKGTDIAVLSFDTAVDILAAADGRVLRIRDGMADDRLMRGVTPETACGNAVLLDRGGGWQTLYCHMAQGSIAVQPGQQLRQGATLGTIGLSGQTTHPHLHLGVLHDGKTVDPFRPEAIGTCDETPSATLWLDPPPYTQTGLVTAGFADHVPTLDTVRSGAARLETGQRDSPLVVYGHAQLAEHGDLLTLTARGPQGPLFHHEQILKAPQVSIMRAHGRKAPAGGWPPGDYLGEAQITRKGQVIAHRFAHVSIP